MKKDQSSLKRVPSLQECTAAGSIEGKLEEKEGFEPIFVDWDGPESVSAFLSFFDSLDA